MVNVGQPDHLAFQVFFNGGIQRRKHSCVHGAWCRIGLCRWFCGPCLPVRQVDPHLPVRIKIQSSKFRLHSQMPLHVLWACCDRNNSRSSPLALLCSLSTLMTPFLPKVTIFIRSDVSFPVVAPLTCVLGRPASPVHPGTRTRPNSLPTQAFALVGVAPSPPAHTPPGRRPPWFLLWSLRWSRCGCYFPPAVSLSQ